jgi:hypothetical protein
MITKNEYYKLDEINKDGKNSPSGFYSGLFYTLCFRIKWNTFDRVR